MLFKDQIPIYLTIVTDIHFHIAKSIFIWKWFKGAIAAEICFETSALTFAVSGLHVFPFQNSTLAILNNMFAFFFQLIPSQKNPLILYQFLGFSNDRRIVTELFLYICINHHFWYFIVIKNKRILETYQELLVFSISS